MQKKILLCLTITTLFCISNANAEVYKSVENGVVTYSDQPHARSETISLPEINIATQPAQAKETANTTNTTNAENTEKTAEKTVKHVHYTKFVITAPRDQETFQNATEIPVSVSITPALQKGDKIRYLFDGSALTETTDTTYSIPRILNNTQLITRGSHTIQAVILNTEGDVVATAPAVTIFAHYQHL